MIIRFFLGIMVVLIVFPALTRSSAGERHDLRYQCDKKTKFIVVKTKEHKNFREIMGNPLETSSTEIVEYEFSVKSSNKEEMRLELKYTARSHETDDPQHSTPPDFSALVGRKVKLNLSSLGEFSDFTGFDDLPEIAIPSQEQVLDTRQYQQEIEDIIPVFAGRPVAIGEEWTHTKTFIEELPGGELTIKLGYRYKIVEKTSREGVDYLRLDSVLDIQADGQAEISGMPFDVSFKGEGEEVIYFAPSKGMALNIESNSTITGSADSEEMGMSIPFRHDIIVRININ